MLLDEWAQYDVCRTCFGMGMGMNITAHPITRSGSQDARRPDTTSARDVFPTPGATTTGSFRFFILPCRTNYLFVQDRHCPHVHEQRMPARSGPPGKNNQLTLLLLIIIIIVLVIAVILISVIMIIMIARSGPPGARRKRRRWGGAAAGGATAQMSTARELAPTPTEANFRSLPDPRDSHFGSFSL